MTTNSRNHELETFDNDVHDASGPRSETDTSLGAILHKFREFVDPLRPRGRRHDC